jgi:hypothetical protein
LSDTAGGTPDTETLCGSSLAAGTKGWHGENEISQVRFRSGRSAARGKQRNV